MPSIGFGSYVPALGLAAEADVPAAGEGLAVFAFAAGFDGFLVAAFAAAFFALGFFALPVFFMARTLHETRRDRPAPYGDARRCDGSPMWM
jgi:hypothetical protein